MEKRCFCSVKNNSDDSQYLCAFLLKEKIKHNIITLHNTNLEIEIFTSEENIYMLKNRFYWISFNFY